MTNIERIKSLTDAECRNVLAFLAGYSPADLTVALDYETSVTDNEEEVNAVCP